MCIVIDKTATITGIRLLASVFTDRALIVSSSVDVNYENDALVEV